VNTQLFASGKARRIRVQGNCTVERRVQEGQSKSKTRQKTNRKTKQRAKQKTKEKRHGNSNKKGRRIYIQNCSWHLPFLLED
jgi:hypothetical protein